MAASVHPIRPALPAWLASLPHLCNPSTTPTQPLPQPSGIWPADDAALTTILDAYEWKVGKAGNRWGPAASCPACGPLLLPRPGSGGLACALLFIRPHVPALNFPCLPPGPLPRFSRPAPGRPLPHPHALPRRQLVTTVWSMGALQIGPLLTDRLWAAIEGALLTQADHFNFSSAPLFLFGAARMGITPSGGWGGGGVEGGAGPGRGRVGAARLSRARRGVVEGEAPAQLAPGPSLLVGRLGPCTRRQCAACGLWSSQPRCVPPSHLHA